MSPYLAEFLGTTLLVLLGDGVVAGVVLKGSKSENAGWLTIVAGWAIGVALAIYAVGSISGAHLNPAVTLALAWSGKMAWSLVPGYWLAQLAGGIAGGVLVWLHYYPHWAKTESASVKLSVFCNAPAVRHWPSNLFSEVLGTAVLVFGLLVIGVNRFAEGLNPLVIGMLVAAIGISLGGTTGWAINPARDLGPRIAHFLLPVAGKGTSDWGYAWVPVVGPLLGALAGAWVYVMVY